MTLSKDSLISRKFIVLIASWAFLESGVWFIAVDFLLTPFAIKYPRQWFKIALLAWVSSHVGGALYFLFCRENIELAASLLQSTPFVEPRMHLFIEGLYERHGAWGALAQSWSFMSFKIWTFEAVKRGFDWWPFFPIVMFSRVFRLFVVSWLASLSAHWLGPVWGKRPIVSWVTYSVLFLGALIWLEK